MKIFSGLIIGLLFFMGPVRGLAQTHDSLKYHIAVFLPLYLDSAFDASGNYRFLQNFPKYLNPGLEFYEGLELAMDSLNKKSTSLDITIYDTRSTKKSIQQMLDEPGFSNIQLILGYVNSADLHVLANVAKNREIPFINVNFPNDGAVTGNPEYVILNSTLRAHCEALYKFVQRNWATSNIFYVRRATQDDDRLRSYFAEIEKNTPSVPLRMKFVNIDNTQNISQVTSLMDSNSKTVILVGSLDENFGRAICSKLDPYSKSYPMKILGMPTWDAITDFNAPAYADLEIYYTTPFYQNPADSLVIQIQQNYKSRFYSRPSDMVYRGYETTLHFGQLLEAHKGHLDGSIGERKFKVFNDFDIQPVFSSSTSQPGQSPTLQYLENKKLYFLKKVNGNVVAVY
ncbi:MAG TPA: ABC transporter substrate-binding protein [Puia sp.]|nr:ABC transporter substrate-binding protein [Puia sp.]